MLGAIAGDIIGSVYEARPVDSKDFPLFLPNSRFTDDTVLTVAVGDAIMSGAGYAEKLQEYFHRYPDAGFGGSFYQWAEVRCRQPYNSWGNGSAMRVSPVGYAFDTLDAVLREAEKSAAVTHNHPEGVKGAQAVAASVYMARTGASIDDIRQFVAGRFGYDLSRRLDTIRKTYGFDVSCQGSVPESIIAFLEAADYEEAVRNAIFLGGDADTMASIAGAIAEAFFGLPGEIARQAEAYLDEPLCCKVNAFRKRFIDSSEETSCE